MKINIKKTLGVMIACWLVPAILPGTPYHVAPASAGGSDGNSGLSWDAPKASISNALSQGDVTEILVSNGTYNLADAVNVIKAVTIRSWHDGVTDKDGTILIGAGTNRCFRLSHAESVVDGFTITNGFCQDGVPQTGDSAWTSGRGAGVLITQAGGLLTNCLVIGNTAHAGGAYKGGGGVYLFGGAVWDSRITGNMVTNAATSSAMGGGVAVYLYSTNNSPTGMVVNCEIDNNMIHQNVNYGGGGVGVYLAALINNCDIHDNNSSARGGGIFTYGQGVITITNSRIFNNDTPTGNGGGICVRAAENAYGVQVADCLISNNYAGSASSGGGIHIDGSATNVILRNCTIVDNVADWDGGGAYMNAGHMDGGEVRNNECRGANAGGGGICAWAGATNIVFIRNVNISNNRGQGSAVWGGGGIALVNSRLENCVITNNHAVSCRGGGVFAYLTSTVANCTILNNTAGAEGGGIYAGNPISSMNYSDIRNCLVAGNLASNRFGGGICLYNNLGGTVSGCTVVDNEVQGSASQQRGAGICVWNTNHVYNCLVWSNRWSGTVADEERDLGMYPWPTGDDFATQSNSVHYTCSPRDFAGARGNITGTPIFVDNAGRHYQLQAGSPGINAGTNFAWMLMPNAVDLAGRPRIDRLNSRVDIGCYEYMFRGTFFFFQ